ncbi:MAG: hypothetical protein K0S00_2099 [Xanthobacteraceae bacterium]|jgi:hypothetical protein|nr:hypothetical protein [Xanthobacteraceae bacterium]
MEAHANGDELRKILCRLEMGMVLTIPDRWLDRNITGTRVSRALLVEEIAQKFHCVCHQEMDGVRFERQGFPFTG